MFLEVCLSKLDGHGAGRNIAFEHVGAGRCYNRPGPIFGAPSAGGATFGAASEVPDDRLL